MNIRRGMFRLWLLVSGLWISAILYGNIGAIECAIGKAFGRVSELTPPLPPRLYAG